MVDLTLHFHIFSGGRDDFAMLNRNASAAHLTQIRFGLTRISSQLCQAIHNIYDI